MMAAVGLTAVKLAAAGIVTVSFAVAGSLCGEFICGGYCRRWIFEAVVFLSGWIMAAEFEDHLTRWYLSRWQ